jgi:hypothetical protein
VQFIAARGAAILGHRRLAKLRGTRASDAAPVGASA